VLPQGGTRKDTNTEGQQPNSSEGFGHPGGEKEQLRAQLLKQFNRISHLRRHSERKFPKRPTDLYDFPVVRLRLKVEKQIAASLNVRFICDSLLTKASLI
jgi:hypothetical protein